MRDVHPVAITVMEEIGIDISGHRSKIIYEFFDLEIDFVVTLCDSARQNCPFFPGGKTVIHTGFPDPSACTGTPVECLLQFRQVRDVILSRTDAPFIP